MRERQWQKNKDQQDWDSCCLKPQNKKKKNNRRTDTEKHIDCTAPAKKSVYSNKAWRAVCVCFYVCFGMNTLLHSFAVVDAHALHFGLFARVSVDNINVIIVCTQLGVGGMCEREQLCIWRLTPCQTTVLQCSFRGPRQGNTQLSTTLTCVSVNEYLCIKQREVFMWVNACVIRGDNAALF